MTDIHDPPRDDAAGGEAEGDPRLEASWPLSERMLVAALVDAPGRRHRDSGADWMAVQLQYGRGRKVELLARDFGISKSSIYVRMRDEDWVKNLSAYDRRRLCFAVWTAGVQRGDARTPEGEAALLAMSAWETLPRVRHAVWRRADERGEPRQTTYTGDHDDDDTHGHGDGGDGGACSAWRPGAAYSADDPWREERISLRDRMLAVLADEADEEAEAAAETVGAGLAGERGGVVAAGEAVGGVGAVGVGGAAAAGGDVADMADDGRARLGQDAGGSGVGAGAGGDGGGAADRAGGADAA